jgi:hypothetical protein
LVDLLALLQNCVTKLRKPPQKTLGVLLGVTGMVCLSHPAQNIFSHQKQRLPLPLRLLTQAHNALYIALSQLCLVTHTQVMWCHLLMLLVVSRAGQCLAPPQPPPQRGFLPPKPPPFGPSVSAPISRVAQALQNVDSALYGATSLSV